MSGIRDRPDIWGWRTRPCGCRQIAAAGLDVFLRAHETYPKQTERFVDRYKRGEGLRAGDPELALRESAARLVASGGNTASEEGRRVAYALESARLGRSMSRAFSSDASLRALFGRDEL